MASATFAIQSVAATPSGIQAQATGSTPNAKRPLGRASIQFAQIGNRPGEIEKAMNASKTSDALLNEELEKPKTRVEAAFVKIAEQIGSVLKDNIDKADKVVEIHGTRIHNA